MVQEPPERSQWMSCIPCPYPTSVVLFVHVEGGGRLYAQPIVTYMEMVDDIIYEGISLVGNLKTIARSGLCIIVCYAGLIT